MTGHPIGQRTKTTLRKWFGPNRDTHWAIAGAVGVILIGSYLVYSNLGSPPTTAAAVPGPQQAPSPMTPLSAPPLAPEKQSSQ
jgi:hypothetical protein